MTWPVADKGSQKDEKNEVGLTKTNSPDKVCYKFCL